MEEPGALDGSLGQLIGGTSLGLDSLTAKVKAGGRRETKQNPQRVCLACLFSWRSVSSSFLSHCTSLSLCMSLSLGRQLCFLAPSMHRVSCHVSTNPTRRARQQGKETKNTQYEPGQALCYTPGLDAGQLALSTALTYYGRITCTGLASLMDSELVHIKAPGPWSSFRMESLAGIRRPVPCSASGHIACNLGPSRVAGAGEQGASGAHETLKLGCARGVCRCGGP